MRRSQGFQLFTNKSTDCTALQKLAANWVGKVIAVLSIGAIGVQPVSAAEIKIQVDDNALVTINPVDSINGSGVNTLLGSYNDPSGKWGLTWDLKLDTTAGNNLTSTANVKFTNQSNTEQAVIISVNQPLLGVKVQNSKMGAVGIVKLNANVNGGQLNSNGNLPQLSALIDGSMDVVSPGPMMYYSPFLLSASGASNSSTNSTFGLPFPSTSLPVGDYEQSHGMRFATVITDGDQADLTLSTFITGTVVELPPPTPTPNPSPTPPIQPQDPEVPVGGPDFESPQPLLPPAPSPQPNPDPLPVSPPELEEVVFQMAVSTNQRKISRGVIAKRGFLHVSHDSDNSASAVLKLIVGKSSCEIGSISVGPFDPVRVSFTRKGLLRGLKGRGTFELANENGDTLSSASVRFQAFGKPVPKPKRSPKNNTVLDCSGIALREIQ